MRAVRSLSILVTMFTIGAMAFSGVAMAAAVSSTTGRTAQMANGLDLATSSMGGWSSATSIGGFAGRPYIKGLAVSTSGGPFVPLVEPNSAAGVTNWSPDGKDTGTGISDVYAFVSPTNSCNSSQSPSPGVCYDPPNRVTVYLAHWDSTNNRWTEDFTTSNSSNPALSASSVVEITIGFKAVYSSLRWSWVNGVPTYWRNTVTPGSTGDVTVRFSPRTMPVMNSGGCSQIPVSTCNITQADSERLQPQIILSMDNTLDVGLSGVLFGSAGAFIGSLESSPIVAGQAPTLTYGVAAPHLVAASDGGGDRSGTFYALVPSNILTLFGTSVDAFDQSILSVDRTGDAGTFSLGWAPWNATDNGTAGQFLTISNISFSAPKFQVTRRGGSSSNTGSSSNSGQGSGSSNTGKGTGSGSATSIKVGQKATFAQMLAVANTKTPAGAKLSAKVSTPKICKVVGKAIKGLAVGTCKGTLTIKPKKGKATKKAFSFKVTKAGKRLPASLHR
jgi:hypothetical protein